MKAVMTYKVSAMLLMGGQGSRFNSSTPKQFHRLSGKAVFLHTLEVFIKSHLFSEIILICPYKWLRLVTELTSNTKASIPIKITIGGKTRQESSSLGLEALDPKSTHVVIHDAVRPFITQKILTDNVNAVIKYHAVDTCIRSTDTVVHAPTGKTIDDIPMRSHYLRGQTPQSFLIPLIKQAHETAPIHNLSDTTDDCTLVKQLGHPVHIVEGSECNIKITTELDLYLAEQILRLPTFHINMNTDHSFAGKTYIITGGSGGIGTGITKALETAQAKVISVSRTAKEFPANLSQASQAEKVFESIYAKYGPVDGLINSVGQLIYSSLDRLSSKDITSLIDNNLHSIIFACRYAKIAPQGHILNIASSSYFKGRKDYAIYSATKAAVVNFTQGIAEERPDHVINILAPQRTATPMRQLHFPDEEQDSLVTVEDVASMALNILQQSHITGTIFEVRIKYPLNIS